MSVHSAWIAEQDWEHVLFLHWKIPKEKLQPFIEQPFQVETFENKAWVTIVLFQATNSKFRYFPKWTIYPSLTQINVRTYVRLGHFNETGVYFFSLNVNSLLGTIGAHLLYSLPFNYFNPSFKQNKQMPFIQYDLNDSKNRLFHVKYNGNKQSQNLNNELNRFLTERYCILTKKGNKIIKIPLTHSPWILKNAEVQLKLSQLSTKNFDTFLPERLRKMCNYEPAIAHYSRFKRTKLHFYKIIGIFK